ncbi:DNA-processing protein DprA [Aneurinibacillus sp. Ricciae_BoGa-3]|uniref:DNA-processing protein DprA n=1 Tax=Aneurinibacillus sp. Ricciae_BoGa-3 TaxID=3022697 RepID=UPI00233F7DFD|nr:DNA-processing protein DprA [Aneurinibacillus sp. Ricciae_BoGa-3]WCK52911.1 DNA-processing protein DprA [Aneurinibacillus sp. Ricciae_BoGa-3]
MENAILIMLGLSSIANVGRKTLRRAAQQEYRTNYSRDSVSNIQEALQVSAELADLIKNQFSLEAAKRKYAYCRERNIHILTRKDERYPGCLSEIPDPPELLYAIGNLELLNKDKLSIVGTRTPTVYGKNVACSLAQEIADRGIPVVSGLARGIDSQAHKGALEAGGLTIGVLGCAIDQIYPNENKALFARVKEYGLLLSEYPPGTAFNKGYFPERNRIISGLSLGTIVVEAASRSGSLITADMAMEQGRDVFAIPGPIHSPKSAGCHYLIQQGAKLVHSIQDIIEEYPHLLSAPQNRQSTEAGLTDEELVLLEQIPFDCISLEALAAKINIAASHLSYILLSLQVKKYIIQSPGPVYTRTR